MFPKIARKNLLDFFFTGAGVGCFIHLCKNNPIPADADMTLADLTEANYTGYVLQAVGATPAAGLDGSFRGKSTWPTFTFNGVSIVTPQTIYGYYITWDYGVGDLLLFWKRLTTPIVMMTGSTFSRIVDVYDDNLVI